MSEAAAIHSSDAFLGGRLQLMQPEAGHRAGLDAVMLAAAAPALPGANVLDVGCGMGVVGLCIAARIADCQVTGIDINAGLVALANDNATANGLSDRYRAVTADLTGPHSRIGAVGLRRESFDVVVANPPFYGQGRATPAPAADRARANVMPEGGLEQWIRFMATMTKPGGRIAIVHLAEALGELLDLMDGRFGAISVFPLYPREGEPAHRVILAGRKASRAGLTLKQGMVLHADGNQFTPEAEAVLRHGGAISMKPRRDDP
jgi:tRNA1(Val) A37 N6-methylase TrmN6